MKYNFDETVDRRGTGSVKYDRPKFGEASRSEVIQMWVADMDFACPPPVLEAVAKAPSDRIFGYTSLEYMPGYYRALCDYYRRHFDWYINSRDVFITPGVVPAINMLVRALTRKGESVIVQRPVYYPFFTAIEGNGRHIANNALLCDEDGRYSIDFDDLERLASQRSTTMMVLCSPHNPVGRAWTAEELTRIHDICAANDVVLVCDEIHCDLTRRGVKHIIMASLFPQDQNIITCTAPSKTFNIAGLERSHIIIKNPEYKEAIKGLVSNNTDPITAAAVTAAFNDCDEWLSQVKDYIDENFNYLKMYLKHKLPKAKMSIPEATYLAWIDVSQYTTETLKLQKELLMHEALYIEEGYRFGREGVGYLRVNVACPAIMIKTFVDRLANRLDRLEVGEVMPETSLFCAWNGRRDILPDGERKLLVFLPSIGSTFSQLYLAKMAAVSQGFSRLSIKVSVITGNTVAALENRLNRKAIPYDIYGDAEGEAFDLYKIKTAPSARYLTSPDDNADLEVIAASGIRNTDVEASGLMRPALFVIWSDNRIAVASYADTLGGLPEPSAIVAKFADGGIK